MNGQSSSSSSSSSNIFSVHQYHQYLRQIQQHQQKEQQQQERERQQREQQQQQQQRHEVSSRQPLVTNQQQQHHNFENNYTNNSRYHTMKKQQNQHNNDDETYFDETPMIVCVMLLCISNIIGYMIGYILRINNDHRYMMMICFGISYIISTIPTLLSSNNSNHSKLKRRNNPSLYSRNDNDNNNVTTTTTTLKSSSSSSIWESSTIRGKLSSSVIMIWSLQFVLWFIIYHNHNNHSIKLYDTRTIMRIYGHHITINQRNITYTYNNDDNDNDNFCNWYHWIYYTISSIICYIPHMYGLTSTCNIIKNKYNTYITIIGYCICIGSLILQYIAEYQKYIIMTMSQDDSSSTIVTMGIWNMTNNPVLLYDLIFWIGIYILNLSGWISHMMIHSYNTTITRRNYSKLYIIWNWMIRSLYGPFIITTLFGINITIFILYNQSIINMHNIIMKNDGNDYSNNITATATNDTMINSVNHIPIIIITMIAQNYHHYTMNTTHHVTATTSATTTTITNHNNNIATIIIPYHTDNNVTTIQKSSSCTTSKIPTLFPNFINIISSLDHIHCILHIPSSTATSITKMMDNNVNNDCYRYYHYYYYSADRSSKKQSIISSQQTTSTSSITTTTASDKDIRDNAKNERRRLPATTISKIILDDKFIEQRLGQLQQRQNQQRRFDTIRMMMNNNMDDKNNIHDHGYHYIPLSNTTTITITTLEEYRKRITSIMTHNNDAYNDIIHQYHNNTTNHNVNRTNDNTNKNHRHRVQPILLSFFDQMIHWNDEQQKMVLSTIRDLQNKYHQYQSSSSS